MVFGIPLRVLLLAGLALLVLFGGPFWGNGDDCERVDGPDAIFVCTDEDGNVYSK